jgi:hypothetical protein
MGIKERMAMKAAERLIGQVGKEDFLKQLRAEIEKQGMLGKEGAIDAAMERIEKSGMKKIFGKLGITREDLEEVFKNEQSRNEEAREGPGGSEQKENP